MSTIYLGVLLCQLFVAKQKKFNGRGENFTSVSSGEDSKTYGLYNPLWSRNNDGSSSSNLDNRCRRQKSTN